VLEIDPQLQPESFNKSGHLARVRIPSWAKTPFFIEIKVGVSYVKRERTRAGLDAARAEGRIGGRKPKLKEDQRKDIIENILSDRKTGAQMAKLYNVSEATVSRIVAAHRQRAVTQ